MFGMFNNGALINIIPFFSFLKPNLLGTVKKKHLLLAAISEKRGRLFVRKYRRK